MSLITRCPACGTMFKVVPDQLKVSQGWVRCGQCADVFDASLNMQTVQTPASVPFQHQPAAAPDPDPSPAPALIPPVPFVPQESAPSFQPVYSGIGSGAGVLTPTGNRSAGGSHPPSGDAPPTDDPHTGSPAPAPWNADDFDPAAWKRQYSALDQAGALRRTASGEVRHAAADAAGNPDGPAPAAEPMSSPAPAAQPPAGPAAQEVIDEEQTINERNDVSFVRQARRQAFWRKPVVRIAAGMAALVLLAGLLFQLAFHQRDAIAAAQPPLRPWLQLMCQKLRCEIGPLRQIESVVIDSSSFSRIGADAYRLGFSIKNAGTQPLAMPALEVTLTDTQERTLLRRVLTPAQFGAGNAPLLPGADFSGSVAMRVSAEDSDTATSGPGFARVTGYRVLAFYP